MLSIEGADISELQAGRGRWNDNHGKGFFNSIGRITEAKKIFKEEDCESDRHRYYWNKVKAPYIYAAGYLYDDEDHPNARAAAAILRNIHKSDTPLQLKASVEGGVLARGLADNSLLARTKIHSVALTFTPANNNTLVEPISLSKHEIDEEADMLLIKSVMHLAETNVPSFRHIARDASATKVQNNLVKMIMLMKELGIEGNISIPSKQKILEKGLKAEDLCNLYQIREQVALLKEEELEKAGIKDSLKAAGIATAMALSPVAGSGSSMVKPPESAVEAPAPDQSIIKQPMRTHQEVYKEVAQKHPLLGAIGAIESRGGQHLDHPEINGKLLNEFYGIGGGQGKSMHEGMKAGGAYGLMPLTAAFILKRRPHLAKKYPHLAEAAQDVNKNHKVFTDTFNTDPDADADFATALFERSKNKTKSDHQLVYSWLHGLKGSWNKYKKGGKNAFNEHPYVKQVMEEYSKLQPKEKEKEQRKPALNKALMAGYGGAGAPTSKVSGAVIQAESLEQGRPGFKYITCDHCGKEQVHSKYQVKCRECGHSMSFQKLAQVIVSNK